MTAYRDEHVTQDRLPGVGAKHNISVPRTPSEGASSAARPPATSSFDSTAIESLWHLVFAPHIASLPLGSQVCVSHQLYGEWVETNVPAELDCIVDQVEHVLHEGADGIYLGIGFVAPEGAGGRVIALPGLIASRSLVGEKTYTLIPTTAIHEGDDLVSHLGIRAGRPTRDGHGSYNLPRHDVRCAWHDPRTLAAHSESPAQRTTHWPTNPRSCSRWPPARRTDVTNSSRLPAERSKQARSSVGTARTRGSAFSREFPVTKALAALGLISGPVVDKWGRESIAMFEVGPNGLRQVTETWTQAAEHGPGTVWAKATDDEWIARLGAKPVNTFYLLAQLLGGRDERSCQSRARRLAKAFADRQEALCVLLASNPSAERLRQLVPEREPQAVAPSTGASDKPKRGPGRPARRTRITREELLARQTSLQNGLL